MATLVPNALLMSSAQRANRCQSWRGAPSSAQMIGRPGDVGHKVAAARGDVAVDQLADDLDARGAHPLGGSWGERPGY
jgi:hypothetical protein